MASRGDRRPRRSISWILGWPGMRSIALNHDTTRGCDTRAAAPWSNNRRESELTLAGTGIYGWCYGIAGRNGDDGSRKLTVDPKLSNEKPAPPSRSGSGFRIEVFSDGFQLLRNTPSGRSSVTSTLYLIPSSSNKLQPLSTTHGSCLHHVGLGQHNLPANRPIYYIVGRHAGRLVIHIGNLLLHDLAERLGAAFCARILPTRRTNRDSLQHHILHPVADLLDRDRTRTGYDFCDHFRSHAGNHLCYQRARRRALSRPGIAVHALTGCGEPCKEKQRSNNRNHSPFHLGPHLPVIINL